MTAATLRLHARYKSLQVDTELAYERFCAAVRDELRELPVRESARRLGVSAAYFGDVKAGRRGVSDKFLKKLKELK